MDLLEIGKGILTSCMNVKAGENVLVITDDEKLPIGDALYRAAKGLGADTLWGTMAPREVSGQEPPPAIAAAMKAADVVLCPMSTSITHTKAKIEAAKAGARIATMPNITEDMFCQGAMTADYDTVLALTDRVTQLLTQASTARIEKEGHVLTLDLRGRSGVPSSGVYRERGQAGNLPSGEAYIAPLEHGSNGSMVIDGSMVGIGLLDSPLEVRVQDGKLVSIQGKDAEKVSILLKTPQNATLCELGIGTNYAARLIGVILEDEKAYHTVHIAFGTNVGFGGTNQADCHIDGIIRNPTLYLDDVLVLNDGDFQILGGMTYLGCTVYPLRHGEPVAHCTLCGGEPAADALSGERADPVQGLLYGLLPDHPPVPHAPSDLWSGHREWYERAAGAQ